MGGERTNTGNTTATPTILYLGTKFLELGDIYSEVDLYQSHPNSCRLGLV